jgi:putative membrane protein
MWGYGPDWGMMGGGWGGGWMGPFMMIVWLIILALAVAAVVWFVRSTTQTSTYPPRIGQSRGLEVLEERYARGEINREEYLQKKADIVG